MGVRGEMSTQNGLSQSSTFWKGWLSAPSSQSKEEDKVNIVLKQKKTKQLLRRSTESPDVNFIEIPPMVPPSGAGGVMCSDVQ